MHPNFYKTGEKKLKEGDKTFVWTTQAAWQHSQTETQEGGEENLKISQNLEMTGVCLQLLQNYRDHWLTL